MPPEGGLAAALRALADEAGGAVSARRQAALEARAPEGAGVMATRRIDAAKKPFEMAARNPPRRAELISDIARPRDLPRGRALDLSAIGDWDLAHTEPLERYKPTKVSDRVRRAYTPENVRDFEGYVRRGIREGGLNWYDVSPLSRVALQEMSPEDFNVLMAMNAGASARSSVADQIKRASLAWYYRKQGVPWPMTSKELTDVADTGYGHLAHENHSKHLGPLVAGEDPGFSSIEHPKYASYHENFMGNQAPLTADTHYQALHGFPMKETYNRYSKQWIEAPDFNKNVDYPFAEAFSSDRARRMGITPPQYQAAAWVGGKEATGVRDARPFTAVYDDLIGRTADQMDITPTQALKKHLRGEMPLMPIERAEGGAVGMAGGGKLQNLEQYIRYRLPKKYASMPIEHLQKPELQDELEGYGGSSRDIYSLGNDRLVKLAKRPRGLYEMSLEGKEDLAQHLPRLDWRSDDNELAVVERMRHTPHASTSFMEPLSDRFFEVAPTRRPIHSLHRDDRLLSQLMDESGLGDFKRYNIHAPDFFTTPHDHWSMRNYKTGLGEMPRDMARQMQPTLLDPGALDYRITNPQFERTFARSFRDVASNRLSTMLPKNRAKPDELIANALGEGDIRLLRPYGLERGVEDFLGPNAMFPPLTRAEDMPTDRLANELKRLMPRDPEPDQGTFGMRAGGSVADEMDHRLRMMRMAGGGTPRNWLRGVKGSRFDSVLEALKKRYAPEKHEDIMPGDEAHYAQQLNREKAMRQWIDTNLSNYMARQMGTKDDPLAEHVLDTDDRRTIRMRDISERLIKQLPPGEVPTHLHGDIELPNAEFTGRGYSAGVRRLTPKMKEENAAAREAYQKARDEQMAGAPAWLKKHIDEDLPRFQFKPHLKPSTYLHDIDESVWNTNMQDPMHGVLDWMRHATTPDEQGVTQLSPDRLARVSVPQAFQGAREWHEALARKAEEAKNKALASGDWMTTHKEYPTGYKWVKYNPDYVTKRPGAEFASDTYDSKAPEYQAFQSALNAEGDAMGHCVGGYCDSVLGGNTQIYSLRDPKGRPHVTVEVQPNSPAISGDLLQEKYGARGADLWKRWLREGPNNYEGGLWGLVKQHAPDIHDELMKGPPSDIVQIKGKGNRKPNDEYLPYVQDFVRSGKWGEVGDLKNTGLRRIDSGMGGSGGSHYMTDAEAAPFARYKWSTDLSKGDAATEWLDENEWVKRNAAMPQSPEKDPAKILQRLRERAGYDPMGSHYYDIPPDYTPPPQQFAAGGQVRPPDFPRETPEQALERAQASLQILKAELIERPGDESLKREIARTEAMIAQLAGVAGETGVKGKPPVATAALAPARHAAPGRGGQDEALYEETLRMLGRFLSADPNQPDQLAQLMAED